MGNPILVESGVASPQSIYTSSTTANHRLGTEAILPGGDSYAYIKAGAVDLAPGKICVAATVVPNHIALATATNCLQVGDNIAHDVTLGATAATENQYADGWLCVVDDTGEAYKYKIKTHAAIASAGTGDFILYDNVAVASGAGTTVDLIYNLYDNVVISVADQADAAVGIPPHTIGDTEYGWIQTGGLAMALADEAIAAGQGLVIGDTTVGALSVQDLVGEPIIATAVAAIADTEYGQVKLNLG